MAKILKTKLEIKSWDEKPYRELDDGRKFTRADVTLAGTGEGGSADGLESGAMESVMYYRPDGTATFLAYLYLTGTLDGRTGSLVLQGDGVYDGSSARSTLTVVEGSGTGELAGIRGSAESVSTHEDYPNMPLTLSYEPGD